MRSLRPPSLDLGALLGLVLPLRRRIGRPWADHGLRPAVPQQSIRFKHARGRTSEAGGGSMKATSTSTSSFRPQIEPSHKSVDADPASTSGDLARRTPFQIVKDISYRIQNSADLEFFLCELDPDLEEAVLIRFIDRSRHLVDTTGEQLLRLLDESLTDVSPRHSGR